MLATLKTLADGLSARAEEGVRDAFSIELIDQKIREAEATLKSAKVSLASLIQRERAEARQIDALQKKVEDLSTRARKALEQNREDLASEAATAIAQMENECAMRQDTHRTVETRTLQMRHSVECATRRLIDLRQGAKAARAVHQDQVMQRRLGRAMPHGTSMDEAEALIQRVLTRDDPFEQSAILGEVEASLSGADIADRMAEHGFGATTKTTAADVLARLKS